MSVFDNKLINYGNLAEFHSKIIDDSSVSTLATWSSHLINNELADKQDVLTAGAGIDISNGVISATGGGGSVDLLEEVTYAQLKSLRDNSQLVPGQQYRITDYVTTTAQANTQSAGHQFDIIVVADSEDKLNENARAINHIFDTSGATTYYKWLYDITGESWLLSDASSYTNQVAGTCDISPMDGYDYYTTSYPIVGTIDENGDEPYTPGSLYRKAILFTEGDTLYYGDYIDEETWNSWEELKQEEDPSYTPQPYPEWFIGKYFLDECDSFTYDGTYTEGIDRYFNNSKLDAWELKYCLDNDTDRFSWAQVGNEGLGFAAAQFTHHDGIEPFSYGVYKRYPERDEDGNYAWAYVNNSDNKSIKEISDWNNINIFTIYTSTENLEIGDYDNIGDYEVTEYSSNVGYQEEGKGVIYYMKDEFNNQCYFDFKNIKIYNNSYSYVYLFGDADSGYQSNKDCTMNGDSYNNIVVDGEVNDGTMYIDTTMFLFNQVGYQNIVEVPEYTAGDNIQIIDNVISSPIPTELIKVLQTTYDNLPIEKQYLTFEALENGAYVRWSKHSNTNSTDASVIQSIIEYSTDLINWKSADVHNYGNTSKILATLNKGERLYIRGNNTTFNNGTYNGGGTYYTEEIKGCQFSTNKQISVYGNIMSMLQKENFENLTELSSDYTFAYLFYGCSNLTTHSNKKLILPATILSKCCYRRMFDTTNITEIELPSTNLVYGCYSVMFNDCPNLSYIKCLATDISATDCTRSWIGWTESTVASTGIFETPQSTNWTTGVSGIPSGWTRVDSDTVSNT